MMSCDVVDRTFLSSCEHKGIVSFKCKLLESSAAGFKKVVLENAPRLNDLLRFAACASGQCWSSPTMLSAALRSMPVLTEGGKVRCWHGGPSLPR